MDGKPQLQLHHGLGPKAFLRSSTAKPGARGCLPAEGTGDDEVLYDNQESPTLTVLAHVWYPALSDILPSVARRLGNKSSGSFLSAFPAMAH